MNETVSTTQFTRHSHRLRVRLAALFMLTALSTAPAASALAQSNNELRALTFKVTGALNVEKAAKEEAPLVTVTGASAWFTEFELGVSKPPTEIDPATLQRIKAVLFEEADAEADAIKLVNRKLGAKAVFLLRRMAIEKLESVEALAPRIISANASASADATVLLTDTEGKAGREDPMNWSATLYVEQVGAYCTATMIGPRVLLTAAHCLRRRLPRFLEVSGQLLRLSCTRHPSYRRGRRGQLFDYALCLLSKDFPAKVTLAASVGQEDILQALARAGRNQFLPNAIVSKLTEKMQKTGSVSGKIDLLARLSEAIQSLQIERTLRPERKSVGRRLVLDQILDVLAEDLKAERINTKLVRRIAVKFERLSIKRRHGRFNFRDRNTRQILLSGYGCTGIDGRDGNDGRLRAGFGQISRYGRHWLTVGRPGLRRSATLCQGDSGGGAYKLLDRKTYGRRVIIGVNAANLFRGGRLANRSFIAKTSSRAFIIFLNRWRRRNGFPAICGLDKRIKARCHI